MTVCYIKKSLREIIIIASKIFIIFGPTFARKNILNNKNGRTYSTVIKLLSQVATLQSVKTLEKKLGNLHCQNSLIGQL